MVPTLGDTASRTATTLTTRKLEQTIRSMRGWLHVVPVALALLLLSVVGCGGSDDPQGVGGCLGWADDVAAGIRDEDPDVYRLLRRASDTDSLCYEAERRGALRDDGHIQTTRLLEVVRCVEQGEGCAPRDLVSELKADSRVARLSPLARLVLLEGVLALSDYDGVAVLETSRPSPESLFGVELTGMKALAYVAGVEPAQARAATRELQRRGIARFGPNAAVAPAGFCKDDSPPKIFGCDRLTAVIDARIIERAQAMDQ
jgi:hypothetical protein